jgi:hypothetical protein
MRILRRNWQMKLMAFLLSLLLWLVLHYGYTAKPARPGRGTRASAPASALKAVP